MFVTRYTVEFFEKKLNDMELLIKMNDNTSKLFQTYLKVLYDNINQTTPKHIAILKSIVIMKFLNKNVNANFGIDKYDIEYSKLITESYKRDYAMLIKIIKLVTFIISKYIKFKGNTEYDNYFKYRYLEHNTFKFEVFDIIGAFYMFDKYSKVYRNITPNVLLNDNGFVMFLNNYLHIKSKVVSEQFIYDLSEKTKNKHTINMHDDSISMLVDKEFGKYVNSKPFIIELNETYDSTFKIKTIFKTINVFKNIGVEYEYVSDDDSELVELDSVDELSDDTNSDEYSEDDELHEDDDYHENNGYHNASDNDDDDDDEDF